MGNSQTATSSTDQPIRCTVWSALATSPTSSSSSRNKTCDVLRLWRSRQRCQKKAGGGRHSTHLGPEQLDDDSGSQDGHGLADLHNHAHGRQGGRHVLGVGRPDGHWHTPWVHTQPLQSHFTQTFYTKCKQPSKELTSETSLLEIGGTG